MTRTDDENSPSEPAVPSPRSQPDWPFYLLFGIIGGAYLVLLLAMLVAESVHTSPQSVWAFLQTKEVRYSIGLSFITCGISAILSLWVAVPLGYLVSRFEFRGKPVVDAVLDIPIVLPPIVVGLCLLILFRSPAVLGIESGLYALEGFVGRNLVPIVALVPIACLAVLSSRLLRTTIPGTVRRRTLVILAGLLVWCVLIRGHLWPKWPFPANGLTMASVVNDDQAPVRTSRTIRTARTRAAGTAAEILGLVREHLDDERLETPRTSERTGLDGRESGTLVITATIREALSDSDRLPAGGQVRFVLDPANDEDRLLELRAEQDGVRAELGPLATLFAREPRLLDAPNSASDLQERLDEIRNAADDGNASATRDAVGRLLEDVEVRESTIANTRSELAALRTALRVLSEATTDGRSMAELREEYERLDDREAELAIEIARTRDAWRTEPVDWTVVATIERPVDSSIPNWQPSFVIPVTYEIPAVILAQFMVACAFAIRTMRVAFDQIDARYENVALVLGCSRSQAFWNVVFPQARRGMMAAGTLAWARSLGEFGPILIFAGATRLKTEVLPTTVFLEFQTGEYEGAVAASLVIIGLAFVVLVLTRLLGLRRMTL